MANFGDALRGIASVLNPAEERAALQEEQQKRQAMNQAGMMLLQQRMQEQAQARAAAAQQAQQERLAGVVRPFLEKNDLEGAAGALAGVPGGMELGLKLREQGEARRSREQLARESALRAQTQFDQNFQLRSDQLSFQRDQALQNAKTAEARAATDKWFREQTLKMQEEALRVKEALAKNNNQQVVGNEAKLRDDYNQLSKSFIKVRDAHQRVMASAADPTAAGDLALIFNYMKVLDPDSVVRESEFAQAAQSGAFGERIKAQVNKVMNGERLSDEIRRDFLDRSQRLYNDAERNQVDLEDRFRGISTRSNVNPDNVIIPYRIKKKEKKADKPSATPAPPSGFTLDK